MIMSPQSLMQQVKKYVIKPRLQREREQQMISEGKKANAEKEKKQAEDMRAKALEKVGEKGKRVVGDDVSEEPGKKEKKTKEIWSRDHSISE